MSIPPKNVALAPAGGAGWNAILAVCALVLTAHMLGATWLGESVAGVPAGIWVIALTGVIWNPTLRRRVADAVERVLVFLIPGPTVVPADQTRIPAAWGWWPRHPVAAACTDLLTRIAGGVAQLAWLPVWRGGGSPLLARAERGLLALPWPTRPLRVGLCMPPDEAEQVIAASGACRVDWFRLAGWDDPQAVCRRHQFDAVAYHDGEGPVRIVTLERVGRAAGCVQWTGLPAELTYGDLFPGRIDPAAVVLEGASAQRVREGAGLLRALLEAAATLARSEHRLTIGDRMLGRRVTDQPASTSSLAIWRDARPPAWGVLTALAAAATAGRHAWPEAAKLASNAASAYFVAAPGIEPVDRRACLAAIVPDSGADAVGALRLAAASVGSLEDDAGLALLVKADRLIRSGQTRLAPLDHAAFLESELAHSTDDPMSVGRAAAGIAMVCAATDTDRIAFVRDDMVEEMAYAGWLVGRDQDRSLLMRVFLEIEHAHAERDLSRKAHHGRRQVAA
ncbi:MAG: hypothetical protein IPJ41_08660 [Phycisphaerales bacterium]|nr:hypothetical protein [Phycisphaerales bacterium]